MQAEVIARTGLAHIPRISAGFSAMAQKLKFQGARDLMESTIDCQFDYRSNIGHMGTYSTNDQAICQRAAWSLYTLSPILLS